jgi:hypothetical protein
MAESLGRENHPVVPHPARDLRIQVPRLVQYLPTLFFGQRGSVVTLKFKSAGLANTSAYPLELFYREPLDDHLQNVNSLLNIDCEDNRIECFPSGVAVHVYWPGTRSCSSVRLSEARQFFSFEKSESKVLPETTLDIRPFIFGEDDMKTLGGVQGGSVTKYTYGTRSDVTWDWGEQIWTQRLVECIRTPCGSRGVNVISAFTWTPATYTTEIGKIFPNVGCISAAPFHGMTDLLLVGDNLVGVLNVEEAEQILCTVGTTQGACTSITLGDIRTVLPEKTGELLASMYFFGTLNYLNKLKGMPEGISWTSYGVLAMRMAGCLVMQMTLSSDGCKVNILNEGGIGRLGGAIQYVVNIMGDHDNQ